MNELSLRCDVGVVFALNAEQGGLQDLLADVTVIESAGGTFRRGRCGSRHVVTAVSGPGREAAIRACETLVAGHRPQWLISAGFCGGLVPQLQLNDVVLAEAFHEAAEATEFLRACLERLGACELPSPEHAGPLVTVDAIVTTSDEKRLLGERTGAIACDMESTAVAQWCARRNVPLLAIRAVSDRAEEDLPRDLDPLMRQTSAAGTLGAVVGALWRRPSSIKDMWRLKERALSASDRLGRYLVDVIQRLPIESVEPDSPPADEMPGAELRP